MTMIPRMGDDTAVTGQGTTAGSPEASPGNGPDTPRGRARTVLLARVVGAAAALLAVVAWLVVGLTPTMGAGSFFWLSQAFEPAAEGSPAYDATDPEPGEAVTFLTYRNEGPVPVTLSVVPDEPLIESASLVLIPTGGTLGTEADGADRVTVPPGREVGVRQVLTLGCTRMVAGSAVAPGVVRLDARTLGLGRRLVLPYPVDVWLRASTDRPGC